MRILRCLLLSIVAACGKDEPEPIPTMTLEQQRALSPQQVLARLKDFNERFSRGVKIPHDDFADVRQLAHGQYPAAAFVDCIDSRVHVDVVFNLGLGMAFSANVAGNVVNPDVLGSIEYGIKVAGSKVVVVLGHTKCGAIKGACDGVKLGNLTQLLAKIQPAIDAVPDDGTPRNSKNDAFTTKVAIANVKLQLQRLRDESPVLRAMEEQGKILIVGALYDVETGLATWLEE